MLPNDLKQMAIAVLALAAFAAMRPGLARAGQQISCPVLAVKLRTAAPILGPLNGPEPWGELHGEDPVKQDGTYRLGYDLTSEGAADVDKWMICYYQDGSYQTVKLPNTTKTCDITTKRDGTDPATRKPHYRVVDIVCK